MRLLCPYCGERDVNEFTFGGPSHVERPTIEADDATWTAYLYMRDNPVGIQCERWLHLYGCGRWFNVVRHTVSHEVLRVYHMGDPKPVLNTP